MQSSREDAATPTHDMDTDDDELDDDDDIDGEDDEDDDDVLDGVREMLNVSLVGGYDGDNEDELDCKLNFSNCGSKICAEFAKMCYAYRPTDCAHCCLQFSLGSFFT
jgi:hypothetical protein